MNKQLRLFDLLPLPAKRRAKPKKLNGNIFQLKVMGVTVRELDDFAGERLDDNNVDFPSK
jgi:hypothetical protein